MITVVLTLHSMNEILYNYLFTTIEKSNLKKIIKNNNNNNNNSNNNNINNDDNDNDEYDHDDNDDNNNKISSSFSC